MKKKILSILLVAAMTATIFAGCTDKEGSLSSADTSSSAVTTSSADTTSSTADAGDDTDKVTITSAEDLNGLTIGCQSGTTGETWVLANCTDKAPLGYKSGMDAALELKNGQIDAIVLDELPAKAIVAQNDDLMILDIKFAKEEYAIAVKKGNTELQASINKTIQKMKDNGDYEKLVNAFIPADGNIVVPEAILSESGKKLIVGTNAAFPPFEYVEGKDIVGFDISMSQQVALDFGATLEISDMAFDSLIAALQAGSIDMVAAGMSVTEERLKNLDFSDPYFESEQVIIVKK